MKIKLGHMPRIPRLPIEALFMGLGLLPNEIQEDEYTFVVTRPSGNTARICIMGHTNLHSAEAQMRSNFSVEDVVQVF